MVNPAHADLAELLTALTDPPPVDGWDTTASVDRLMASAAVLNVALYLTRDEDPHAAALTTAAMQLGRTIRRIGNGEL